MFLCSLRYCLKCYFSKGVYSFFAEHCICINIYITRKKTKSLITWKWLLDVGVAEVAPESFLARNLLKADRYLGKKERKVQQ